MAWDKQHRAKAKAEGLHLVEIRCTGKGGKGLDAFAGAVSEERYKVAMEAFHKVLRMGFEERNPGK